ncbi:MAG: signal peptide peptidase SppA [Deltaproteobacteria bacterium]|nr:signal peptide peptidase SppA [Deltaproteobacteria bacterium]
MLPFSDLFHRGRDDLFSLTSLLRWAREDGQLKAVVVCLGDLRIGWARLQSLRRALLALKGAGKKVWVCLAEGGMPEYYLATAADKVLLAPTGHLAITGLAVEATFLKGALDKLGVEAQVSQVGKYKAAGEPFTREGMSAAHRDMMEALLDDLYAQVLEGISSGRNKSKAQVRTLIDQGSFLAHEALDAGLVDSLRYEDEIPALLAAGLGPCQTIDADRYRRQRGREVRKRTLREGVDVIGLLSVNGMLKRGETLPGPEGAVGVKSFARDLQQLREDPEVKAVVVRIASPGGSGVASDLMWRELVRTRQQKPVIVSMGDVAASGGYYLAVAGDTVFAEEGTITGSIGVIAGKAVLQGLYGHLGVAKEIITRGQRAALLSDYLPWAPADRERIEFEAHAFYRDFVHKVATCRRLSAEAVEGSAQGRVWTGRQAWTRGLVDQIGGLEEALAEAKRRVGIPLHRSVAVVCYPRPRRLWPVPPAFPLVPRSWQGWWEPMGWAGERVWALLPFHLRFL